jgi:hypothetical protein
VWRWLAVLLLPLALAVEPVKPTHVPDVCGFVSVQVCVSAKSHIKVSRIVHIRPSQITAMSNPENSPDNCIRLYIGQRTIFVVGDYDTLATRIHKAQVEQDEHKCGGKHSGR